MSETNFEAIEALRLFFDDEPVSLEISNSSHGTEDFREAVIAEFASGQKYVLKLAHNTFTFPEKIEIWQRNVGNYRELGYYCPAILRSKKGDFPWIRYKGCDCVAYAEEFAKYRFADSFNEDELPDYMDDAFIMTAKIAALNLDYSPFPSGYCLFERFCSSDETDEIMENALEWKRYADTLSPEFQEQTNRIWRRWSDNRDRLERIYPRLPTSVFQADLNSSNILLDDNGKFVGMFDFNLCGRDVLLNYLFREIRRPDNEEEVSAILHTLKIVSAFYRFSELEKESALLLYRCIKPLWFTKVQELKEAGSDISAIRKCLDSTEIMQTKEIDFPVYMA